MNNRIQIFLKYAEHHEVQWQSFSTLYCVNTFCTNCVIYEKYNKQCSDMLHESDLKFLKKTNPEYFL